MAITALKIDRQHAVRLKLKQSHLTLSINVLKRRPVEKQGTNIFIGKIINYQGYAPLNSFSKINVFLP